MLPRTCDAGSVAAELPFCDHRKPTAVRIGDLLQRLTREEKLGLVQQASPGFLPRLNLKEFQFFNTCQHGWWTSNVTTFGMPVGMAASFDAGLMRRIAEVVGAESRALSQRDYGASFDQATGLHGVAINWLVCKDAAEVNMLRHPLWGRASETYGEDPYLTGTMGEAFTKQLQQPDPSTGYVRTTAVTRHLVVYSGPESLKADGTQGQDRFSFNANVSAHDLEDYFYPPFEASIARDRGGSRGAMCSDAAQNGVPSCASELLMTRKPREWNATDDFFVVSDMGSYWAVYAKHKYRANTSDALLTDLAAGLDILYLRGGPQCRDSGKGHDAAPGCPDVATTTQQSNETWEALEMATNGSRPDSRFTLADLDAKAGRALRIQFELGVFDPVSSNPYGQPVHPSTIDGPAHRKVAREATAASIVLLKNQGGLLPLSKAAAVAAIGPYIRPRLQPSLRQGRVDPYVHAYAGSSSTMVDILDGLNGALHTPATFVQGCETNQTSPGDPNGEFAAAKRAAAAADVTVLAVGLTAGIDDRDGVGHEEEMRDRLSLELPRVQRELIAAVHSVAKKVVLVIVAGSAVPFNASAADAALYAIYGGAEAGNGLADVLFGDVPPSGRLPFTVFSSLDQLKPMEDYDLTSQPGRTHLYYDDASVARLGPPQYWFGFGLSFSRFAFTGLALSGGRCSVSATVQVKNVGEVASREVAQLYLNRPGSPAAPWPLRGYSRTALLAPGASATVAFELSARDLSTVQADGSRRVVPGTFTVKVGSGSPRDPAVSAGATATIVLSAAGCAP